MTMKKWLAMVMLCMVVLLVGCGNNSSKTANIEGTLPEIMEKVNDGADIQAMLMDTEVNDANFQSYFFIEPIKDAEGLVSEAAINAIAHTVQLLRVPEGTDAEKVRTDIEANLNPRKWICVEAEKTAVVAHGDLILVAMSTPDIVDKVVANFDALAK